MRKLSSFFFLLFSLAYASSCSNDAYDTGDSRYSYLRADFVEATSDSRSQLTSATTDDGVLLSFSKPVTASWITKPDSTYRALLYYNIGEATTSAMTVEPLSLGRVYVLEPLPANEVTEDMATDPVHFQSSWLSGNGNYANLSIALMTGIADSIDTRQSIGLICDSVATDYNGRHTFYYTLLHSQGNAPQYYKSTIFVSVPTTGTTKGDVIRLSLNTYDGIIIRDYNL